MMKKKVLLVFCLIAICSKPIFAGEGMWLPIFLKSLNEAEMKSMGMKISAEDIYSVNKGSLKDAIVHFGGFCTSEVISNQGLLLTNHHCGYGQIQSHSTVENNLLKNGFWAKSLKEELPNPGLYARFIDRIEDVTAVILNGVNRKAPIKEQQAIIDENIKSFQKRQVLEKFHEVSIRPFFAGNQYFAFFTITYPDVRLVGTPPESIGKFGSDTDNWMWPRHTGDFAIFRIYADENNKPAEYSENNKPYRPKHHLPISLKGVKEGDFTMVFGFPGRTDQYLPSPAVAQIMDKLDPAKIKIRDAALKVMDGYMRKDEAIKIKYASKYASLANAWKKWIGEVLGLKKTNALQKKQRYEEEFQRRASKNQEYSALLPNFSKHYAQLEESAIIRDYYTEIMARPIETIRLAAMMDRLITAFDKDGTEGYESLKKRMTPSLNNLYKDFSLEVDRDVAKALLQIYADDISDEFLPKRFISEKGNISAMVDRWYQNSLLPNKAKMDELMTLPAAQVIPQLKNDEIVKFFQEVADIIESKVIPVYDRHKTAIDSMQSIYMEAQMELMKEKKFYPDANSTLRVTYGKMSGYFPKDGVHYLPNSYLDGVVEKYVPGDYEFDVPEKLLELERNKDYGPYADSNGKMPVCFIAANHTTGGNSGSPAINADGHLIGLNFDRVWEGTMSDINYDERICRNIMVDARYILFVVDKFAGATHLIKEMTIVK